MNQLVDCVVGLHLGPAPFVAKVAGDLLEDFWWMFELSLGPQVEVEIGGEEGEEKLINTTMDCWV